MPTEFLDRECNISPILTQVIGARHHCAIHGGLIRGQFAFVSGWSDTRRRDSLGVNTQSKLFYYDLGVSLVSLVFKTLTGPFENTIEDTNAVLLILVRT